MSARLEKVLTGLREVYENKGADPPELTGDTLFSPELGLDSLDYAELVVRLERAFGFDPFADGAPRTIRTVADLAEMYAAPPAGV